MTLAVRHRVIIDLSESENDSELAESFVAALLNHGFVQPMAQA